MHNLIYHSLPADHRDLNSLLTKFVAVHTHMCVASSHNYMLQFVRLFETLAVVLAWHDRAFHTYIPYNQADFKAVATVTTMQDGNCQQRAQLFLCLCCPQGKGLQEGLVQKTNPLRPLQTCLVCPPGMAVAVCHNPHLHIRLCLSVSTQICLSATLRMQVTLWC